MFTAANARYKGVFPVVPTTFDESGALDLESQKRCVDFMIDAGLGLRNAEIHRHAAVLRVHAA